MTQATHDEQQHEDEPTAPHGCFAPVIAALIVLLALCSCASKPPTPDKTIRVDVYEHSSFWGLLDPIIKLLPLP